MEDANKEKLVEEILSGMIQSKYKTSRFWSANQLSKLCLDYRSSSYIFKRVVEALKKESCDLEFVWEFLGECVWILRRMDIDNPEEMCTDITTRLFPSTNNGLEGQQDTVRVCLEFLREVRNIMEEKRFTPFFSFVPDNHAMNQSLSHCIIDNIPLLLRFGVGLEFTTDFYRHLQVCVRRSSELCTHIVNERCFPKRRMILVLLVIFWYVNGVRDLANEQWNKALKLIWRSIPDANLCRREFFEVFADSETEEWRAIGEHYGKMVCEDDFTELPAPRSMAHLSRMKIREALNSNKQLPMGVYHLPVPKALQTYVLLGS